MSCSRVHVGLGRVELRVYSSELLYYWYLYIRIFGGIVFIFLGIGAKRPCDGCAAKKNCPFGRLQQRVSPAPRRADGQLVIKTIPSFIQFTKHICEYMS